MDIEECVGSDRAYHNPGRGQPETATPGRNCKSVIFRKDAGHAKRLEKEMGVRPSPKGDARSASPHEAARPISDGKNCVIRLTARGPAIL
jgi:hypothetical protein